VGVAALRDEPHGLATTGRLTGVKIWWEYKIFFFIKFHNNDCFIGKPPRIGNICQCLLSQAA
jgi:hypothetical protein